MRTFGKRSAVAPFLDVCLIKIIIIILNMPASKKVTQGGFVWVLSGRTKHPAKFVVPIEKQDHGGMDREEVEIQWLSTGFIETVSRNRVTVDKPTATIIILTPMKKSVKVTLLSVK